MSRFWLWSLFYAVIGYQWLLIVQFGVFDAFRNPGKCVGLFCWVYLATWGGDLVGSRFLGWGLSPWWTWSGMSFHLIVSGLC
jgi:hypothetical protein